MRGWRREAGYRVEIVALAVPEAVSQLGILDRYLRLGEDGWARYVSWDNDDACAAALLDTLTTGRTAVWRTGAGREALALAGPTTPRPRDIRRLRGSGLAVRSRRWRSRAGPPLAGRRLGGASTLGGMCALL